MKTTDLTLFYDGLCHLCSADIAYFRKRTADDPTVHYVDITDPAFDARGYGLDPAAVHQKMHVKVGDEVRIGVDAFIAIWENIRGQEWKGRVARWPGVYQMLWVGYVVFAKVRPWLPRKKAECEGGVCKR